MIENIAIFGITGALGREVQVALESEQESIGRFFPVAGVKSAGQTVMWRGVELPVMMAQSVAAEEVDVAIFACHAPVVRQEAARFLKAGARVIDASGTLSRLPSPPGIATAAKVIWPRLVAGVEPFAGATHVSLADGIGSTLAPILEAVLIAARQSPALLPPLASVDVVVVKSASGQGRDGATALSSQAVQLLNYQPVLDPAPFPTGLAFNVFAPAPDDHLLDEAHTVDGLRQLFPDLGPVPVNVTTIWAGAFSGLAAVATLRFAETPSLETFTAALHAHPDCEPAASALSIDDDDFDLDGDEDPTVALPAPSDAFSATDETDIPVALRDALDSDCVRFQRPTMGSDGSIRVIAMADPLHRTAIAAQALATLWMADEDE